MRFAVSALLVRLSLIGCVLAPVASFAQTYPNKPVTIVVAFAAGGGADIMARSLAQKLSEAWGQPVLVDNRPGAGALIGTTYVAKAPPDGYTFLMASPSHIINIAQFKNLAVDPGKAFSPVVLCASGPLVLVVGASSPIKSLKEFIAATRARQGEMNFASAGEGSSPHLAGALFNSAAKVSMVHIPYKGTAPALTDLLGGQVQAMFAPVPTVLPYLKAGTLRALAVTSEKPFAALHGIPPVASELPGYEVLQWWGLIAPPGTPASVIAKVNADADKALASPEMRERLASLGADPGGQSPAAFTKLLVSELPKWAQFAPLLDTQVK